MSTLKATACVLGGVVAGYLGTVVALSVWAWEERANGSDVTPASFTFTDTTRKVDVEEVARITRQRVAYVNGGLR